MDESADLLIDRLAIDTSFREEFREDPGMALASIGIEVPDEAVDELGDLSDASDMELEERVSKWWESSGFFVWTGGW